MMLALASIAIIVLFHAASLWLRVSDTNGVIRPFDPR